MVTYSFLLLKRIPLSNSDDRESAYMQRLIHTSVPIRLLNRNECGSRKNHNCMQKETVVSRPTKKLT